MKRIIKTMSFALCVIMLAGVLGGCNTKKVMIDPDLIDVHTIGNVISKSNHEYMDKTVHVKASSDVKDVKVDLAKFFKVYPEYIGKNFYFTRDDVKKGDGTLIKGYAWVEVGKSNGNKLFKKLGTENDEKTKPITRGKIAKLEEHEGKARMYILKNGEHVLYLDNTPESNMQSGDNRVTFRLHGNHGRAAELKVVVKKE